MSSGLLALLAVFGVAYAGTAAGAAPADGVAADRVVVGPATYHPLYAPTEGEEAVPVPAFAMDATPVTNAEYLAFVEAHPEWRRDRVARVRADQNYLAGWAGPDDLGDADPDGPVVDVSWFAAKAYCAAEGARLPTLAEWEVAAAASDTEKDAHADRAFQQRILRWYITPATGAPGEVGQGRPNAWGLYDLHGLVWEWVYDFNDALVADDDRDKDDPDTTAFCGAGALGATDANDTAAFLRTAFRSALRADFTTSNLGFRCASSL